MRHVHGDAHMCGAMYVDAPPGAAPIRFHSPLTTVMRFCPLPTLLTGNKATAEYVEYEPTPGRLILWDGWLEHEVPLKLHREVTVTLKVAVVKEGVQEA